MNIHIAFPHPKVRALIKRLLKAGLDAADPVMATKNALAVEGSVLHVGRKTYDLKKFDRIVCVGAGKASGMMAVALEQRIRHFLSGGLVVVKDQSGCRTKKVSILEASHPVPDARSVHAAKKILAIAESLTHRDLMLVLISGGASSLLAAPAPGLTLTDKKQTTNLLLRSGAPIQEINAVRKHLSAIKGGRLAAATQATIISLVLSDVLGDDLGTIGSGPTAPDPTTFEEACEIVKKYRLWSCLPSAVQEHLHMGVAGLIPETPNPRNRGFARVRHEIIGNNRLTIEAIQKQASAEGLHPFVMTRRVEGEAREVGKMIASTGKDLLLSTKPVSRPACLIWGGEPTVTVRGKGKGGRAQEVVLSAALHIAGQSHLYVAGFGTDGNDGPTDMAGAIVDGHTVERANRLHLNATQILNRNNSYGFFQKVGGHIFTGPTGTNVNDIYVFLAL